MCPNHKIIANSQANGTPLVAVFLKYLALFEGLIVMLLVLFSPPIHAAQVHKFWIGLGQEERWDSGAYFGNDELMSRTSPEVGYRLKDARKTLEAKYGVELIHHYNAKKWSTDHWLDGEYKNRLTRRLTLEVSGNFARLEDMTSLPRFGLARITTSAIWARGGLTASYRWSPVLNTEIAYRGEATRVNSGSNTLNLSNLLWAQIRDQITPRWEMGIRYRYQILSSHREQNADTHSAGLSARVRLTRHAFAMLELGPSRFQANDETSLFWRGNAELAYDARGTYLGLILGRDILGAGGYAPAVWSNYAQAAVTWSFRESASLYIAGGYYLNGIAPDLPADAEGWNGTVGLEIHITRHLSMTTSYDHIQQLPKLGSLGVSRELVRLKLLYKTI